MACKRCTDLAVQTNGDAGDFCSCVKSISRLVEIPKSKIYLQLVQSFIENAVTLDENDIKSLKQLCKDGLSD